MLYICIPAYNEAPTIGVLLWRLRRVLQEASREYEVIVFNDGSTDSTEETLKPYQDVLPLTILGGAEHIGYAGAVDALLRAVAERTRYPRRDAVITLQADFTDQPEIIPELIKRFEGGADLVVVEGRPPADAPIPVRRLRKVAAWAAKFARADAASGVTDPFGAMRLYRISLLRDLLKRSGTKPVVTGSGWVANLELLRRAAPFARRIETIASDQRFDVRTRESRVRVWPDGLALFRARIARGGPQPRVQ